jgi:hemerythrin superfamily protein
MNAIEVLKADHARVQALFRQYEAAGQQAQSQRELAEQIFTALEVHASLEEELFYPAVRAQLGPVTVEEEPTDAAEGDADTDEADGDADTDLLAEAQEEHQEVKTLIATLRGLEPDDAQFQAMFAELREGVEEHVGMEEDELMPAVAAALGPELERLGRQLEERQAQLMAGKA